MSAAVAGRPKVTGVRLWVRAFPTLLRIGLAEALAYRAEMLVWMLTTTMPLVSMVLWQSAAQGTQLGPTKLGSAELTAYFLLTLIVRLSTSSWVLWLLTEDIRSGALAQRLLRPVHPLLGYVASQLASMPLRGALVLPLALALLWKLSQHSLTHDPAQVALFVLSLPGAWLLSFLSMTFVGLLAFYIDSAAGLFYVWVGLYTIFSGYLIPLVLLPAWLGKLATWLPFQYMLEVPVRMLLGWPIAGGARDTVAGRLEALQSLGIQYLYAGVLLLAVILLWRAGLKRYASYGG